MAEVSARIGVIGGSGLYALDNLEVIDEVKPATPWGEPSDSIVVGSVGVSSSVGTCPHAVCGVVSMWIDEKSILFCFCSNGGLPQLGHCQLKNDFAT